MIRLTKEQQKTLQTNLREMLMDLSEYHEDLFPNENMTLEELMELYYYWGEKYNAKYIPEQTEKDTVSVFLAENFERYLNGDDFENPSPSIDEVFISKDLLISELSVLSEQERLEYMGVYDIIKSLPSKRERTELNSYWIEPTGHGMPIGAICSNCGGAIAYDFNGQYDLEENKFCYHCGRKMTQRDPELVKTQALEDIQKELKDMGDCSFSAIAINNIFESSVVQEQIFVNNKRVDKEIVLKALLEIAKNANK